MATDEGKCIPLKYILETRQRLIIIRAQFYIDPRAIYEVWVRSDQQFVCFCTISVSPTPTEDKEEVEKRNNTTNATTSEKQRQKKVHNSTFSKVDIQEILKKSVITPDFEKLHSVPMYDVSDKKLREQRRVCNKVIYCFFYELIIFL